MAFFYDKLQSFYCNKGNGLLALSLITFY